MAIIDTLPECSNHNYSFCKFAALDESALKPLADIYHANITANIFQQYKVPAGEACVILERLDTLLYCFNYFRLPG